MGEKLDLFSEGENSEAKWEAIAFRLIMSPCTRKQLSIKLRDRRCPEEIAGRILDRFQQIGAVDDKAYALLYIDAKRNFGSRRLRDELRARGVSHDDIQSAMDEAEIDEDDRALSLAHQWCGQVGMTPQKLDGRLRRRGFSSSAIRNAFDELRGEGAGCFADRREDFPDEDFS